VNWFQRIIARFGGIERRTGSSLWSGPMSLNAFLAGQGRPTVSGVNVTPGSALTLTAAYAAINTIATDLASLPLRVYRRRRDEGRDEVRDHPAWDLLAVSPDDETTSMRWRQALYGHLLGWGNGYAEITFDSGSRPTGLYLLNPAMTWAERRPQDKRLFYRIGGSNTLPPGRTLHIAGLGFDGLSGYSPVAMAREAIALGLATEAFGGSFFGNGAHPGGYLSTDKKLLPEARESLRTAWNMVHQGSQNAHKTPVLTDGLKWNPTTVPPEDAQFLATRQFQVVEIARMYRLPPSKLGDFTQSHLANIEASNLDYITTTLMPWCEQVEQELNFKLLTREERAKGFFIEHNMSALLRGDMKSRAEFYTKLRDLGVLSPNQICRFENLNPIGSEGDIRLVPLNMTTLENAGKPVEPKPAKPAPAPSPAPTEEEPINGDTNGRTLDPPTALAREPHLANGRAPH
jgi:HK97 family phage portal protein